MRRAPIAVLVALAMPAAAQPEGAARPPDPTTTPRNEPPLTLPSRDVTATYRLEGAARTAIPGGLPGSVTVVWGALREVLRFQAAGRQQVVLLDLRRPGLAVVDPVLRSVMLLPIRPRDVAAVRLDGAKFTRLGPQTVAGLPCLEWDVQAPRGHGRICLTADGVPLRAAGTVDGHDGRLTAIAVNYAATSDAALDPPPDYLRFPMLDFGGGKK